MSVKKILVICVLLFNQFIHCTQPPLLTFKPTKTGGWSLRKDFLQELAVLFGHDIFIESGTCYGTTAMLAKDIFNEVHTIELEDNFYNKAVVNFAREKNVKIYHGDSGALLPSILKNLKQRNIIFWLDGHFSGGTTAKGHYNTPIMAELQAIKESGILNGILLIDDICCFSPDTKELAEVACDYPTMNQVRNAILEINPGYIIIMYGDIAIAYPANHQIEVSPLIHAMTVSRFFSEKNTPYQEVFAAESYIAQNTTRAELEALWDLCTYHFGWHRTYPYLWYSLGLLSQERYAEAYDNFKCVLETGYDDWRVYWYALQAAYRSGKKFEHLAHALWKKQPNFLATSHFFKA